jgi:hypothetical protein
LQDDLLGSMQPWDWHYYIVPKRCGSKSMLWWNAMKCLCDLNACSSASEWIVLERNHSLWSCLGTMMVNGLPKDNLHSLNSSF